MKFLFLIIIFFSLQNCKLNEDRLANDKKVLGSYNGYSFDKYVDFLFNENKSRGFPDIDKIPE